MTTPAPSGPPVDQRHGAIVEVLVHNSLIRRHPNSSAKTILEAADAADRAAGVVRVDTTDDALRLRIELAMMEALADLHDRYPGGVKSSHIAVFMAAAALRVIAEP